MINHSNLYMKSSQFQSKDESSDKENKSITLPEYKSYIMSQHALSGHHPNTSKTLPNKPNVDIESDSDNDDE